MQDTVSEQSFGRHDVVSQEMRRRSVRTKVLGAALGNSRGSWRLALGFGLTKLFQRSESAETLPECSSRPKESVVRWPRPRSWVQRSMWLVEPGDDSQISGCMKRTGE